MHTTRRAVLATATAVPASLAGCLGWQADPDNALVDSTVEGEQRFEFEADAGVTLSVDVTNDVGDLTQFELWSPEDQQLVDTATGSEYTTTMDAPASGVYEGTVSAQGRATVVIEGT